MTAENLRSIASGTDTNAEVRLENAGNGANGSEDGSRPRASGTASRSGPAASESSARNAEPCVALRSCNRCTTAGRDSDDWGGRAECSGSVFHPHAAAIQPGGDFRRRRAAGGFLSGGTQDIAIVERVDKERGQAIISATRMPNTPGGERLGHTGGDCGARGCAGQFAAFHRASERERFTTTTDSDGDQRGRHPGSVAAKDILCRNELHTDASKEAFRRG